MCTCFLLPLSLVKWGTRKTYPPTCTPLSRTTPFLHTRRIHMEFVTNETYIDVASPWPQFQLHYCLHDKLFPITFSHLDATTKLDIWNKVTIDQCSIGFLYFVKFGLSWIRSGCYKLFYGFHRFSPLWFPELNWYFKGFILPADFAAHEVPSIH